MKHQLLLAALLLSTSVAQAKTVCRINSGTDPKQEMVFDHNMFNEEVTSPRYLVIKKGEKSVEEIQFNSFDKWLSINGATLVTLGPQNDRGFGITVGHVDMRKDRNALPIDAMALGQIPYQKYLVLIVPAHNLSVICSTEG